MNLSQMIEALTSPPLKPKADPPWGHAAWQMYKAYVEAAK